MEYKTVESILMDLHSIAPQHLGAFRSRLRVLRDAGVPAIDRPGKGSRVDYTFEHLWELHLAIHLERFGLPPSKVGLVLVRTASGWLERTRTFESASSEAVRDFGADLWCLLDLDFSDPSPTATGPYSMGTHFGPLAGAMSYLREYETKIEGDSGKSMFSLFNLSKLTRDVEAAIRRDAKWQEIYTDSNK